MKSMVSSITEGQYIQFLHAYFRYQCIFIDSVTYQSREIMCLVASVRLAALSWLNRVTYYMFLDIWYKGRP